MINEIINKSYDKPRDMFDDACLLIADSLKEHGFKYSKSQATIKKKDKLLTYIISFYSSHYNYIAENKGHVVMEFYCTIEHKKEIVFRLNQKELRSETYRFELFDNKTRKLNLKQIENTLEFINTYFLPVIFSLQSDTDDFLENVVNQPVARFDDYGFRYERKLFEIFNRQELIEKYENEIEEFNSKSAENDKSRFKKYLQQRLDINKLKKLNTYDFQMLLQSFWHSAVDNMESRFLKNNFEHAKKQFEKLSKPEISEITEWLIEYYMILCSCKDYIADEKIKEQAWDVFKQFKECFNDNQ